MAVYRPKCATVLQCYDARTTSIPSQCTCVVDLENLRHLASLRLSCMRTLADLIPVRGRSPSLPFAILRGSGRALGRARVVSDHSALGPSTSVWAFHEVSHLHRCYMFCYVRFVSSHHMAKPRKAFLGDIRGDRLDHRIAPELFICDSVFPCFALNPS